ncbi:ABC transporter substrate-binding protein [Nocardioides panacis]|uniref:ABC transporter substrate-binding protein n=1 Tax=Nocardioides panacis TaxID=2849501 RepID=A0A975SXS1_9ACTN|nr:ABC transporter substrate-binding protein [Nocardioides panacis]QWZ07826.1 ABC transporter substrate-binding protein [Nocardioides panacis]
MRLTPGLALATLPLLLATVACAPVEESTSSSDQPSAATSSSSAPAPDDCAPDKLALKKPGTLTIGTDSPAYEPWFSGNDPTNGKGFESAVAYAVAKQLGFTTDQVSWVKVPFNNSYAPGAKSFDFDINQISITPKRAEVVSFSDGYYSAAQGVIALKKSRAAGVTSLADLQGLKLGAQTGTTSLTAITDVIKPATQPLVFDDTNQAKQALLNGQVDAILSDLPTAFYITAAEIPKSTIVGQFQPETGQQEEFGMLFEKGSTLVPCVDQALSALRDDGTLAGLEKQWLSDVVDVPVLQ